MLKLKYLRESKNLLQKDIAKKLNCSTVCIGSWEKGRTQPSINDLINLANIFECSVDYLIGREDDFGNIQNNNTTLTTIENELLSLFKKMDIHSQNKLIGYAYALTH